MTKPVVEVTECLANKGLPPLPSTGVDEQRRKEADLRMRMLAETWEEDLISHMRGMFSDLRNIQFGRPDTSRNVFLSVTEQLSVLYNSGAKVFNKNDSQIVTEFTDGLERSGLWEIAAENQRHTLAVRENFLHVSVGEEGLIFRNVPTSHVYAEAPTRNPDVPYFLIEAIERTITVDDNGVPRKKRVWTWDVYDLREEGNPSFKIVTSDGKRDITSEVLSKPGSPVENMSGGNYPYFYTNGRMVGKPFIPYSIYHAKRTNKLWNWSKGSGAVQGSMTMGGLNTFSLHMMKNTAWAQKYGINVKPAGMAPTGDAKNNRLVMVTDPGTILFFELDKEGQPASVGTFAPAADPVEYNRAVQMVEQSLSVYFGISPDDLVKDIKAESGYALVVKRQSVREAQRQYEGNFRRGDTDLISKAAAVTNIANSNSQVPEDGWLIEYPGIPKTAQEKQQELSSVMGQVELGLASLVDGYMLLNPAHTRETAIEALKTIQMENAELSNNQATLQVARNL